MDVGVVAAAVMPYLGAVAGAYGGAVVDRVTQEGSDVAADATLGLGRRILRRLLAVPQEQAVIEATVVDLGEHPDDEDCQAAVRALVKRALRADDGLRANLLGLLAGAGVSVVASGERSVAAQTISGVVVTGNDATIQR